MTLLDRAKQFLFGSTDNYDETEHLRRLFECKHAKLNLSAVYGRPYPNTDDQTTVVFPYTLETSDGSEYGAGAKEFILPDDGLNDTEAPLTQFLAARFNIEPEDVEFEHVTKVAGSTADARFDEDGDVRVDN